ncbi:MAG: PAS domain S-box protein, partial [Chloroflexi bacterium]|nr:PAS domain S-box protein [Chloroflexota bacterium]
METSPLKPPPHEPGDAAARLDAGTAEIVKRWEARVTTALAAARRPPRTVLSDHLPALLTALAQAVSGTLPGSAVAGSPDGNGPDASVLPFLRKALLAADTPDAGSLSQEIMEYRLLRDTILEVLESAAPVTPNERRIITNAIDGAIQHTASELIRLQQRARYWSEEQYRIVVENMRDYAIFMMDPDGHIVSWNAAAEEITRFRVDDIVGEHFAILFTPEDRKNGVPAQELSKADEVGKAEDERWHMRKDGSRFWATGVVSPLRDDFGTRCGYSKLMRDDTPGHFARRRQAIQHAITRALASATSLSEAASGLLASIGQITGWEFGALWTVDPAGPVLRCQQVWHTPGKPFTVFEAHARQEAFAPGVGLPGRCWSENTHVWVLDVARDTSLPRASAASRAGLHGAIAFPILLRGQVLGVFEFFSLDSREPDTDFIEMMDDLGSQVGQFIERARAEETRNRSEALKAGILQASLDAVITMDAVGRVIEFNPAAERIFGYRREDAVGQLLVDLIVPPTLRESHRRGLARYRETGIPHVMNQRLELTGMRSDGSEFPVELTIVRVPGTGPVLFTGFLRDITEQKQLESQLRQRAEELVEADRHKNEFLAMLAHELRNPLGPIINSVHVLRMRGSGDPAVERAGEVMERQVEHMSLLVEDLLNITRIAHGKIRLRRKPLDLVDLVRASVEDHRSNLESEGLTLSLELPESSVTVLGDRLRLTQVLGNLLSNAGKFTDPGGQVRVRVEPTGELVT